MVWDPCLLELMTQTVRVRSRSTVDEYGRPTYATATEHRAHVSEKSRLIKTDHGEEVMSSGQVWIADPLTMSTEDQVELPDGRTPEVVRVEVYNDENGPNWTKVYFG